MSQTAPVEGSPEDTHQKLKHYIDTKRYIEEPEILPWYKKDLHELKPRTRELFEQYCNIDPASVETHIKTVVSLPLVIHVQWLITQQRDSAFKIFPYPCVGNWGFLDLSITYSPVYDEVLQRIKSGDQYLDIGCCMGQDVRKLVHDGAPSENTFGSDLKGDFWEIGYDMFLDKSTLLTKFIQADVFDAESDLKQLEGKISLVNAASFFHLFDYGDQVKAAKRVVRLLKDEPGVMVIGRQGGKPEAGSLSRLSVTQAAYWHNPESWEKLWRLVGEETGTKWEVKSSFGEEDLSKRMNINLVPDGTRFMTFVVRRI
jgi:SAM-dependent methyltransferase